MRAWIRASGNERRAAAARRGGRWRPARLTALSAAALTAAAVAGCGSSSGTSSQGTSHSSSGSSSAGSSTGSAKGSVYTIHAIVSETGSAAFLGTEEAAALNALAKHVNATGGIDGHPLKFAISDNQSTASTSVSLASPLVSQVPALIVGSVTTVDRPVDDLVTSSGPVIYDLSPGDHPKPGSFVYSSSNSTTNQTQAFINFAQSKGWTHVAAITSTDASGQDGWTNIDKAVAGSHGAVTITDHETFAPNAVSVTTQLSKIKASNPQALLIWTTGTPLGAVLKGMQELGMDSLPTMTTNGNASTAEMQRLSGELPAQLYFPGAPFMAGPQNLTGQTKTEVQAFDTAMQAAGKTVPDEGNALSWDPGLILVSALRKLGTKATASQIHNYIDSLTHFAGINGTYNFTDTSIPDNRGLTISSVFIAQWNKSQGHWVAVSGPAGKGKP
ncbi:MAG TPA: ABC transporter substrate-binding protein [Streptosporangiaceae bacterium]|nr:ABC transporter substrate-binding protein [Streptosporangiaceae bacterium]